MFEFIDLKYRDFIDIPALFIEKEKITTLVGSSGSGKTTILRMLNKMISPTQGKIIFNGTDLKEINSVAHRRYVTMLSQSSPMFPGSIRDNFYAALKFQERELPGDEVLYGVLEQVKLKKSLDSPANTLSGGEKQRVALGRVLLINPEVYLLDEPSSALDDETEDIIIGMLAKHAQEERKTIVMVTHSKAIAERYAHTIIEIAKGKSFSREVKNERNN